MSSIRKLPSGKWQATVRGPDGRRHTHTAPLRSAAKQWAASQETQLARGEFRDPRLGDVKVGEWHDRVARARGIEDITKAKNASLWRTHCEPEWGRWPMSAVTRMEAQEWVNRLRDTKRARHQGRAVVDSDEGVPALSAATIADIAHLMSNLYRLAMREHPPVVSVNPFADLELPRIEPRPVEFYEPAEATALYDAIEERSGAGWRTLTELGMQVGLRPGELFGLHDHRVDWLRGQLEVTDVMTRLGLRQHPKSRRSHRVVPVPPGTLEGMSVLMAGRPRGSLVFTTPAGGPVTDGYFRAEIWNPAVKVAGIRRFPPRIMRHTAASWLVQDGVPLYDVQALLGHEDYATTMRYAHLAPDAHGRITASWTRRLGAPVAHEPVSGGSLWRSNRL
jgi:integrase